MNTWNSEDCFASLTRINENQRNVKDFVETRIFARRNRWTLKIEERASNHVLHWSLKVSFSIQRFHTRIEKLKIQSTMRKSTAETSLNKSSSELMKTNECYRFCGNRGFCPKGTLKSRNWGECFAPRSALISSSFPWSQQMSQQIQRLRNVILNGKIYCRNFVK